MKTYIFKIPTLILVVIFFISPKTYSQVNLDVDGSAIINQSGNVLFKNLSGQTLYEIQTSSAGIELDCGSGDLSVGLDASGTGSVYFNTINGSRRMTINSAGRVGIGSTSPIAKLHIVQDPSERAILLQSNGTGDLAIRMNNAGGDHYIFDDEDQGHSLEFESANSLVFNSGGPSQRMEIAATGHIGINLAPSSGTRLRIAGGTENYGILCQAFGVNTTKYGVYGESINYSPGFNYYGIYGKASTTGTNSHAGYFNGDLSYTGTFASVSDLRLKKDIVDLGSVLDKVLLLKSKSYLMKVDAFEDLNLAQGPQMGFISQDVQKIFPDLVEGYIHEASMVDGNPDQTEGIEILKLNYIGLIPVLTKAIQEQQVIISSLLEDMNNMKAEMAKLKGE